jgi:putative transposase
MTDTIDTVPARIDQQQLAKELVEAARAEGVELVGPGGLLTGLTKTVLETALEAEMSEHLGYDRHDVAGRDGANSRNGTRTKTVLTEIGPVQIEVPRDRDASFDPVIVRKRQRRLDGIDEIVLSLTARGLTTGEVAAHFDEVYGAKVSRDTISRITDKVLEEMTEWQQRPLDPVYPVLFVDAIHVKVRDGQVTNRPFYVVIGVTVEGHRDILGIWAGDGGEGAKYWLQVLTEIKNRGVADACIVVCDGLHGLPESITTVWPQALVQACVLHLIRNTFRYASRKYWETMAGDLEGYEPECPARASFMTAPPRRRPPGVRRGAGWLGADAMRWRRRSRAQRGPARTGRPASGDGSTAAPGPPARPTCARRGRRWTSCRPRRARRRGRTRR